MIITGGPGTGKSTVVKGITKVVNNMTYRAESAVLRMGTTGTAAFVISGATCHSILYLPVNRAFADLTGRKLRELQDNLQDIKVIIIDEVSMLGKNAVFHSQKTSTSIRKNRTIWWI